MTRLPLGLVVVMTLLTMDKQLLVYLPVAILCFLGVLCLLLGIILPPKDRR